MTSFGITLSAAASWLRVTRNTRTHEILAAALAQVDPAHERCRTLAIGQPNRLADRGLVDRAQPLSFRFDGKAL